MLEEKDIQRYIDSWVRLQEAALTSLIQTTGRSYLEEQDKGVAESEWILGVETCPHFKDHSELRVFWRTSYENAGNLVFEISTQIHGDWGSLWLANWMVEVSLGEMGIRVGRTRTYGRFGYDPRLLAWALKRGQEILDRFLDQVRRRREGIQSQKDYLEALEWLQSLTVLTL